MTTAEKRRFVMASDDFLYLSRPGDGQQRYVFKQGGVKQGLDAAYRWVVALDKVR